MTLADVFYKEFTKNFTEFRLELRLGTTDAIGDYVEFPHGVIGVEEITISGAMQDNMIHGLELSKELSITIAYHNLTGDWEDVKSIIEQSYADSTTVLGRLINIPNNWTLFEKVNGDWYPIFDGVQAEVPTNKNTYSDTKVIKNLNILSVEKWIFSRILLNDLNRTELDLSTTNAVYGFSFTQNGASIIQGYQAPNSKYAKVQNIHDSIVACFNELYAIIKRETYTLEIDNTFISHIDFYEYINPSGDSYKRGDLLTLDELFMICYIQNSNGINTSGFLATDSKSARSPFKDHLGDALTTICDSLAIRGTFFFKRSETNVLVLSFSGLLEFTQKQRYSFNFDSSTSSIPLTSTSLQGLFCKAGDLVFNNDLETRNIVESQLDSTTLRLTASPVSTNADSECYVAKNIKATHILKESFDVNDGENCIKVFRRKANGLSEFDLSEWVLDNQTFANANNDSEEQDLVVTNGFNTDNAVDCRNILYNNGAINKVHYDTNFYLSRKYPEIKIEAFVPQIIWDSIQSISQLRSVLYSLQNNNLHASILQGLDRVYGNFALKGATKQGLIEIPLDYHRANFNDIGNVYLIDLSQILTEIGQSLTTTIGTYAVLVKAETDFNTMQSNCTFFLTAEAL